jgi:hypothetical protein
MENGAQSVVRVCRLAHALRSEALQSVIDLDDLRKARSSLASDFRR